MMLLNYSALTAASALHLPSFPSHSEVPFHTRRLGVCTTQWNNNCFNRYRMMYLKKKKVQLLFETLQNQPCLLHWIFFRYLRFLENKCVIYRTAHISGMFSLAFHVAISVFTIKVWIWFICSIFLWTYCIYIEVGKVLQYSEIFQACKNTYKIIWIFGCEGVNFLHTELWSLTHIILDWQGKCRSNKSWALAGTFEISLWDSWPNFIFPGCMSKDLLLENHVKALHF